MALNSVEAPEVVTKLLTDKIFLTTTREGNVTVGVITVDNESFIGVARCMPKDKFSKEIGEGIALGRAVAAIGEHLSQVWEARSVTQSDWKAKHSK